MGYVMGRASRFLEGIDAKVLPTAILEESADEPADSEGT